MTALDFLAKAYIYYDRVGDKYNSWLLRSYVLGRNDLYSIVDVDEIKLREVRAALVTEPADLLEDIARKSASDCVRAAAKDIARQNDREIAAFNQVWKMYEPGDFRMLSGDDVACYEIDLL